MLEQENRELHSKLIALTSSKGPNVPVQKQQVSGGELAKAHDSIVMLQYGSSSHSCWVLSQEAPKVETHHTLPELRGMLQCG